MREYEQHGKGAIEDLHDGRDRLFTDYLERAGSKPFDWDKGYDVEKELGIKLSIKDQKSSNSCVGQSVAYYKELYEYYLKRSQTEKSARSIYSQIALSLPGGAYFRDGMMLAKNYGINTEHDVPSYEYGEEVSENFIRNKSWMSQQLTDKAKYYANSDAYMINGIGIEVFAQALEVGKGYVMGVRGTNNGTWYNKFPKPPTLSTPQGQLWGHAVTAVGAEKINNKKYIKIKNSWGLQVGENGYQYLGEEWFGDEGRWIFNPWVFAPKIMFKQEHLKHATAYTIFIKKINPDGSSERKQRQGFCINKGGENKLIIAGEAIITKLREDIAQKEYKDSKGQSFWAFSTPKITIEISDSDYNALNKYDQSWNKLEDVV